MADYGAQRGSEGTWTWEKAGLGVKTRVFADLQDGVLRLWTRLSPGVRDDETYVAALNERFAHRQFFATRTVGPSGPSLVLMSKVWLPTADIETVAHHLDYMAEELHVHRSLLMDE